MDLEGTWKGMRASFSQDMALLHTLSGDVGIEAFTNLALDCLPRTAEDFIPLDNSSDDIWALLQSPAADYVKDEGRKQVQLLWGIFEEMKVNKALHFVTRPWNCFSRVASLSTRSRGVDCLLVW